MTDISEVMLRLSPETQKRIKTANSIVIEKHSTGSVGLDLALEGGLAYGHMCLLWGNKSAGKSSLALQTIAAAQKQGKTCAWIDAEGTFDPTWAKRLDVDIDQLIIDSAKTVSHMADTSVDLIRAGVDILVIDSISALAPSSWFEKDDEMKGFDGTNQIGSFAKDITKAVNMINVVNDHTSIIFISQIRNKIGSWGSSQGPMGGEGIRFYSSTIIKLWSSARDDEQKKGQVKVGDKLFNQNIGREVTWTVEFNKMGPPSSVGRYDFYYKGSQIGIDYGAEIVDLAIQYGIIEKRGAWFVINQETFHGKDKAVAFFRDNIEEFERLKSTVNEQIQ
jgi:recombination protein RecA